VTGWTAGAPALSGLDPAARARLDALTPALAPRGTVLFRPGEAVKGYVVVLSGEVGVHLVGPTGREILLYAVTPGEACVQSTLGLLGGGDYTAEAVAETDTRLVLLPRPVFLGLIDDSPGFRRAVFAALAARMQDMMQAVERVAFQPVDARLAAALLSRADAGGEVHATQAELAVAIGSAREVVARKLDTWARAGWVETGRGVVRLTDPAALRRTAGM
jgi:CRP/FNR family transcriptional regulator